jgi:hypothetical protein
MFTVHGEIHMQVLRPLAVFAVLLLAHSLGAQDSTAYRRASNGTRVLENDGGVSIKVLVESAVLGGGGVEVVATAGNDDVVISHSVAFLDS